MKVILVIHKSTKNAETFTALVDAAKFAGIPYKTLGYRLVANSDWWEDADMILARIDYTKSAGRAREQQSNQL